MEITELQETEIATRLGLIKPNLPKEVAEYQEALKQFGDYTYRNQAPELGRWSLTISEAVTWIADVREYADKVEQLVSKVQGFNDVVVMANKNYTKELKEYMRAIELEADRPRQEWKTSIDMLTEDLKKELRRLNREYNKAQSRYYETTEEERETAQAEMNQISRRQAQIRFLTDEIEHLRYSPSEGIVTEEKLWNSLQENSVKVEALITKLAELATA